MGKSFLKSRSSEGARAARGVWPTACLLRFLGTWGLGVRGHCGWRPSLRYGLGELCVPRAAGPRGPWVPELPGEPSPATGCGPGSFTHGQLSWSDDCRPWWFRAGEVPGAALAAARRVCDLSENPVRPIARGHWARVQTTA